jgi:hypothetical protein
MIRFLMRLLGLSGESRNPSDPQREEIGDREPLGRFLFSDKLFARTTGRVKRQAFAPPENKRLSVFHITNLTEAEIWRLGREVVGVARGQDPRARADIQAVEVRKQSLTVVLDQATHPRHASVEGWPEEKEEVMAISLELATKAILRLP